MKRLLFSLLALFAACSKPPPESAPAYEIAGVLIPTELLGPPFLLQQRIRGKYEGRDLSIDCVLQLADGKLSVIGLTPFNSRAFVLEQRGTSVKLEKFVDRDIPFDPAAVLYDIHRVFFRGLSAPQAQGTHRGTDHGDVVTERWKDGHIVERRFQSLEGPLPQLVVVEFDGAPAPVIAPRVRLTNVAFAYTLEIETLEQQLLAEAYTLTVEQGADAGVSAPESEQNAGDAGAR